MRTAATSVLLLLACCAIPTARADSCEGRIPESLNRALSLAFPGYRMPLEYDNAPDDVNADLTRGGTGCLGVASADFTGEGKKDYVVGLTERRGRKGLAAIALPRNGGWVVQRIRSWAEDARVSQYVDVVKPGRYERFASSSAPVGADETAAVTCPNWGAAVGTIGASRIVYCRASGRWLHVWTAVR